MDTPPATWFITLNGQEYQVEQRPIGSGGGGTVHAGHDQSKQSIALKLSKLKDNTQKALLEADAYGQELRILNERQPRFAVIPTNTGLVKHPDGNYPSAALVMPLFSQGTLGERLRDSHEKPTAAETVSIMAQLTIAVRDAGVTHNDIKPDNVLIAPDQMVALADWGSMRPVGAIAAKGEGIRRTPGYTSPESTKKGTLSQRSDVYAIGATVYEYATHNKWRASLSQGSWEEQVNNDKAVRSIPGDPLLERIVQAATHHDPKARSRPIDVLTDLTPYPEARVHYNAKDWDDIASHYLLRTESVARRELDTPLNIAAGAALAEHYPGNATTKQSLQARHAQYLRDHGPVMHSPAPTTDIVPPNAERTSSMLNDLTQRTTRAFSQPDPSIPSLMQDLAQHGTPPAKQLEHLTTSTELSQYKLATLATLAASAHASPQQTDWHKHLATIADKSTEVLIQQSIDANGRPGQTTATQARGQSSTNLMSR